MKVLIVEDEEVAADLLSRLINDFDPAIEIVKIFTDIKCTMSFLQDHPDIDLLFMDIQVADGISLDLFDKIDIHIPVIFTTAFSSYTLRAFKVNSIDYLLKPIGSKELERAINKFKSIHKKTKVAQKNLSKNFRDILNNNFKTRFAIKAGQYIRLVSTDDICCFMSKDQVTFLVTKDKKISPIDFSLEMIESQISPKSFFRVSRQFIVNINFIESMVCYNSRMKVILKNDFKEEIIVSRDKVHNFKEWISQ